ncbi:MAG: NUDIX domain-containing protein [Pseudomonadales bacterium]|nr:NUDIX domain-containing protein [Candidatus Woesebacteria bacterium]MCB9801059.1 NUDIX domain-containing protein [Pseudomonadales bacterium]
MSIDALLDPKLCYTAGGMLIHEGKVLLVKHKKLGIWLNPGGHIDEDELPHQAAEREFWEETGVRVRALDPYQDSLVGQGSDSEFFPNPISTNVHWVNRESYDLRMASEDPTQRVPTKKWKRGCEQHVGFFYLLEAIDDYEFEQNVEETDGIAWFTPQEVEDLETTDDIRKEILLGFELHQDLP